MCFLKRVVVIVELDHGNILSANIALTVVLAFLCFPRMLSLVAAMDLCNILPFNIALIVSAVLMCFSTRMPPVAAASRRLFSGTVLNIYHSVCRDEPFHKVNFKFAIEHLSVNGWVMRMLNGIFR